MPVSVKYNYYYVNILYFLWTDGTKVELFRKNTQHYSMMYKVHTNMKTCSSWKEHRDLELPY